MTIPKKYLSELCHITKDKMKLRGDIESMTDAQADAVLQSGLRQAFAYFDIDKHRGPTVQMALEAIYEATMRPARRGFMFADANSFDQAFSELARR